MSEKEKTAGYCEECELDGSCERHTAREQKLKLSLISRLNKVEGQIRGIKGMVERDAYCDDILNQIAAAQAAINSLSKLVLENHIRGCLVKKIRNGEDEIIDELLVTIGKLK
jgi:DNA-binding FrmR family transcriptional regulator